MTLDFVRAWNSGAGMRFENACVMVLRVLPGVHRVPARTVRVLNEALDTVARATSTRPIKCSWLGHKAPAHPLADQTRLSLLKCSWGIMYNLDITDIVYLLFRPLSHGLQSNRSFMITRKPPKLLLLTANQTRTPHALNTDTIITSLAS